MVASEDDDPTSNRVLSARSAPQMTFGPAQILRGELGEDAVAGAATADVVHTVTLRVRSPAHVNVDGDE